MTIIRVITMVFIVGFLSLAFMPTVVHAEQQDRPNAVNVKDFFSNTVYNELKISPTGEYYLINSDAGDRDRLVVIDRATNKPISSFEVGENKRISEVYWVTDERFIFQARTRVGLYDDREGFPNLYAANADGRLRKEIFTWDVAGFELLSLLPNDPDHILIARYFWRDKGQPKSHIINIHTGKIRYIADQPDNSQQLFADNEGNLRLGYAYEESSDDEFGQGSSNLYFKPYGGDSWERLTIDSFVPGDTLRFAGFSDDNRYTYIFSDMDSNVQEVYKFDTKTRAIEQLTHDSNSDVNSVVKGLDGNVVGFEFVPDTFTREYIESSKATKLLQSISKAFGGQRVTITSATKDQKQAVIYTRSDVNPGEFYLFDTETLEAKFIAARLENLKSSQMANMQPIRFNARDGVELNGYLTMPKKKSDAPAPLIVKVHGGPHGVRDYWGFNTENQYFAANGFAVLQINFRGSGGYGKEFLESGYGEWGRKMQDDVTDATHWAIENGYADEGKICIYGASYGGYSSLMGVIREPDLYQCAVGYVGVYSLPLMYEDGDIPESDSGVKYLREVIGENESELRANSPVYQADNIKVPVFLVHGSEDVRVPMSHFEQLTQAFDKHGINYKTLVREEGHGFQKEENKFELYPRLVQFFNKHLN
ncbi:alpha/beta hydrolase family protein [Idiomarina loihiensis]|uniref:Secreted dipeptidyl aminopeptidase n=1 Tax=Idiomarina loihiensis (strain ATCC BAA-735 / DSM 15497 / L2-TR) TaxID=283942 RepID=Q5QTT2_IDILO|nr:S9 family peptidase [Idiomarina loihiensis]AAV82012.1 Secreted dipeptidyl aminopeptidase [Idiomarina loihiensis L2TR]AGM36042.1 secreted dipeptidyl aminopeptidase [Idiomarina loihiensis GSL 199]